MADSGSYGYIGTAETTPEIELNPKYMPVMNDIAGRELPFWYINEGIDGVVKCVFSRYDEAVVTQLLAYNSIATGGGNGYETRLNRGSLVTPFKLVLQFSFYGTAVAQASLPAGYRFNAAIVAGFAGGPVGTEGRKVGLAFQCFSRWNSSTGQFTLYDQAADIATAYSPN